MRTLISPHFGQHLVLSVFLNFGHSNGCVVVSHCGFILRFPNVMFPMLIFYLYIFFSEVPLKSLSYFIKVIYFLIVMFLKRNLLIHILAAGSTEQSGQEWREV